jgi:hypothetical protein
MKKIGLLVGFVLAMGSHAFAVGEFVGMKASYDIEEKSKDGKVKTFIQELEVMSYHSELDKYLIKNSSLFADGYWESVEYFIEADWIMTDDQISVKLNNCEASGDSIQMISTAAGEFKTCRLVPEESIVNWVGLVPFGLVKATYREANGTFTTSVIRAFNKN